MALKKWVELPWGIRKSPKRLYEYIRNEISGVEGDVAGWTDSDTVYDDTALAARVKYLEDLFTTDIGFTVKDDQGTPAAVEGAVVTVATDKTGTTGAAGGCTVKDVLYGSYTVTVVADGFDDYSDTIVVDASHTSFNITLTTSQSTEVSPGEQ